MPDPRPQLRKFNVEGYERRFGMVAVHDCRSRAFSLADAAVNALSGVDGEEIGAFIKAVDRAHVSAFLHFAVDTVLCDNIRHQRLASQPRLEKSHSSQNSEEEGLLHSCDRILCGELGLLLVVKSGGVSARIKTCGVFEHVWLPVDSQQGASLISVRLVE